MKKTILLLLGLVTALTAFCASPDSAATSNFNLIATGVAGLFHPSPALYNAINTVWQVLSVLMPLIVAQILLKKNPNTQKIGWWLGKVLDLLTVFVKDVQPKTTVPVSENDTQQIVKPNTENVVTPTDDSKKNSFLIQS